MTAQKNIDRPIDRRDFLKSATLGMGAMAAVSAMGKGAGTASKKPNVVFIMTDQQHYKMMSCMGDDYIKTPNMDKLANMGYRFNKAYCSNPVCMASRFTLLTSHQASVVGLKGNAGKRFNSFHDEESLRDVLAKGSLGSAFTQAGYDTLYSGKTHLYGSKDASRYGFTTFDSDDPYEGPAIYAEKVFRERAASTNENPFLLFLSFMNPHDICYKAGNEEGLLDTLPPEKAAETRRFLAYKEGLTKEEFAQQVPPPPSNLAPIAGETRGMIRKAKSGREWGEEEWDTYRWMYYRLTESVDALVGRVLTALEKSGLQDDTIIVFTSDHGDMNGAHRLVFKNVLFEEAQRIPFIFAGKGIKKNVADDETLACNGFDLIPTLCDLVDIECPEGIKENGISLKPHLMEEGTKNSRKYLITECLNGFQIHDGRYKYTVYETKGNPEFLVDLVADPGEEQNFLTHPEYQETKTKLKRILMADIKERGFYPLATDK
ncbi:sulfatase family protein [Pelagicoccus mobilis]|uniref:Sulfatase-like hydrolase/transferase n=1 Tax=Pelagicoccus mobilis TaxID=415221 RepID=A0A934RZ97_9BACT|nr:sulfatase-like hydrolase/transferase [Pelagicoccus mobilis]MBK1880435.1 sulfatase-like hydrolase/transferase [Pelagicoccus mobilis]